MIIFVGASRVCLTHQGTSGSGGRGSVEHRFMIPVHRLYWSSFSTKRMMGLNNCLTCNGILRHISPVALAVLLKASVRWSAAFAQSSASDGSSNGRVDDIRSIQHGHGLMSSLRCLSCGVSAGCSSLHTMVILTFKSSIPESEIMNSCTTTPTIFSMDVSDFRYFHSISTCFT